MSNGQSWSASLKSIVNVLLFLTAILGGAVLVTSKLTSQRPLSPAGTSTWTIGEQTIEARLWEDPFAVRTDSVFQKFSEFFEHIAHHTTCSGKPVRLMPVMISGGPYSEDRESRIRARFAVVSALGQSGYAPENAERVGEVRVPWHSTLGLEKMLSNNSIKGIEAYLFSDSSTNRETVRLRYEWFRPRVFWKGNDTNDVASDQRSEILVIWLDDTMFEDLPTVRLSMLLNPLIRAASTNASGTDSHELIVEQPKADGGTNLMVNAAVSFPGAAALEVTNIFDVKVSLIGPRRSSTLRALVKQEVKERWSTNFLAARETLKKVDLYSATASAMPEVFLWDANETNVANGNPKEKLCEILRTNVGFASARFFNASDSELATEVFDEMRLRRADPANPANHIVLITEWDTFYSRMISLSYRTTLSVHESKRRGHKRDVFDSIRQYLRGSEGMSSNLHTFVYLRGLDGRTVVDKTGGKEDESRSDTRSRERPKSLEDLLQWQPDANKAEGQAQYDYLARMGDRLAELRGELRNSGQGDIKAMVVAGSDAYDTLLVLQALRRRFPDVLFFTHDLDARFWHPTEREWSRNLNVVSSYGLSLHPRFQGDIAPFRDSLQTAIFAAVLATVGNETLGKLDSVPPRRFEIGHSLAMDLSSVGDTVELHPPPRLIRNRGDDHYDKKKKLVVGIVGAGLLLAGFYWLGFFRTSLSIQRTRWPLHPFASMQLSESDVGGRAGSALLLREISLRRQSDSRAAFVHGLLIALRSPSKPKGVNYDPNRRMDQLLEVLNGIVAGTYRNPAVMAPKASASRHSWTMRRSLLKRFLITTGILPREAKDRLDRREWVNEFLGDMVPNNMGSRISRYFGVVNDMRNAATELFCCKYISYTVWWIFWICIAIAGVKLALDIWRDTFKLLDGEPFSLTAGISAWPNIIVRNIGFAVSVGLVVSMFHRLSAMFYEISREFRLAISRPKDFPSPPNRICAAGLWREFYESGRLDLRCLRAIIATLLYIVFGVCIFKIFGFPFEPTRGDASAFWASPWWLPGVGRGAHPFFIVFLFLCFLTIDASINCLLFIRRLSANSTDYPHSTTAYFRSRRGNIPKNLLDEWIDTQLIADLTERVQTLLWFPAIGFLFVLAARNNWTDHWPWSPALIIMCALNLGLAMASVVILQSAARSAKRAAVSSLEAKVKQTVAKTMNPQTNAAYQAQALLEETKGNKRGAFTDLVENPVLGVFLLAPSGTALVEIIHWIANR
jgi:hypothetical protein